MKEISDKVWKTSRAFDLDSNIKNSKWDRLVNENVLQKSLANDSMIYVEGDPYADPNILSKDEFVDEGKHEQNWDAYSGGDEDTTF